MVRRLKTERPTSSRYLGVCFNRDPRRHRKPWQATIGIERAQHFLGYFASEDEAARAYDTAVRAYGKPGATLNFPDAVPAGDTCAIPLTRDSVALVDAADYAELVRHKWQLSPEGRAVRIDGERRTSILMHRAILNAPDGIQVDHINHNPLDNRRANLRLCTHGINIQNRPKTARGVTSQYVGVCFHHASKLYRATIRKDGRVYSLRYYTTEEAAARAYDQAARELYGPNAFVNFPDEVHS